MAVSDIYYILECHISIWNRWQVLKKRGWLTWQWILYCYWLSQVALTEFYSLHLALLLHLCAVNHFRRPLTCQCTPSLSQLFNSRGYLFAFFLILLEPFYHAQPARSGHALLFSNTIFGLNPSPGRSLKGSCCLQLCFANTSCNQILSCWFVYSSNSSKLCVELAHKRTFLWFCVTASSGNSFVQLLACRIILRFISAAGWLSIFVHKQFPQSSCINFVMAKFMRKRKRVPNISIKHFQY